MDFKSKDESPHKRQRGDDTEEEAGIKDRGSLGNCQLVYPEPEAENVALGGAGTQTLLIVFIYSSHPKGPPTQGWASGS